MTPRDPHPDNELIDDAIENRMPSHSGSSGGNLARQVGERDEWAHATGEESSVTRVRKSDKPRQGDVQNLPNRGPA